MIQKYHPNFFFDGNKDGSSREKITRKWGFEFCEGVFCTGLSDGLLMFWDDTIHVNILNMNKNIIIIYITDHQHNHF